MILIGRASQFAPWISSSVSFRESKSRFEVDDSESELYYLVENRYDCSRHHTGKAGLQVNFSIQQRAWSSFGRLAG
jgi:hypothetical protein